MALKDRKIIRWMITTLWIAIGAGTVVLLVAAVRIKDSKRCTGVYINIHGVNNNFFVDKNDILNAVTSIVGSDPMGEPVSSFDLQKMETGLTKNIWVKSAQLFFDNNELLKVNVLEREPIARIFTTNGATFYIDSSLKMLPLSEKFSARLPVFTGFPTDNIVLAKVDSELLMRIKDMSIAVQKDSFSMAMIDQIDITPQRTFELIPKIGNPLIVFGDAIDIQQKLYNLQLFYKKIITKAGWNYYSSINLEYKGQIVAKKRGAADRATDSLRTLQLMQTIAANAKLHAEDTIQLNTIENASAETDTAILFKSVERNDEEFSTAQSAVSPLENTLPIINALPKTKPILRPKAVGINVISSKPILPFIRKVALPKKEKIVNKSRDVIKKPFTVSPKARQAEVLIPQKSIEKKKVIVIKKTPIIKPKPPAIKPKPKSENDY